MPKTIAPEDFINLIRDEADALRDALEDYYKIEIGVQEVFERPIGRMTGDKRIRHLRMLHAPITALGFKLDGDDRHFVLSQIFGRSIVTADSVTNVEALALARTCSRYNRAAAEKMMEYILDKRQAAQRV